MGGHETAHGSVTTSPGQSNWCALLMYYANGGSGRHLFFDFIGGGCRINSVLDVLTGHRDEAATAILDYLVPLKVRLDGQDQGRQSGWQHPWPCRTDELCSSGMNPKGEPS